MKTIIILSVVLMLIIGMIVGFYIYDYFKVSQQLGINNPSICEDSFVGPLSQSQLNYCRTLNNNGK